MLNTFILETVSGLFLVFVLQLDGLYTTDRIKKAEAAAAAAASG